MAMTLAELAHRIGARIVADDPRAGDRPIERCAKLEDAGPADVAFLANPRYLPRARHTRAAALIAAPGVTLDGPALLVADDPYIAFRDAAVALHGWRHHPRPGISDHAWIDPSALLGELCTVRPFAYIAPHAVVGKRCILYPGVYVGKHARIGDDCVLYPNVAIYDHCTLGHRVVLHAGCVIGNDGFGYATHRGEHHKIPAAGIAAVHDDVEMGAACVIDRATLGATTIGQGTRFSNAVTIGHGCSVGPHNLYVAQVGLAGSVTTGSHVVMGGQVGVAGHLHIGDRARIAAKSGVMHDVPPDAQVGGTPARPLTHAKRALLAAERLPELLRRVQHLEKQLADLQQEPR